MLLSVEPFDPARHKRGEFQTGIVSVDNYLKFTARKLFDANAAAVFVVADETDTIVGFYSLSAILIDASELETASATKLFGKFKNVPATLLAMLGVDTRWQNQGIGRMLLADALRRSLISSKQVGSYCVVLDVLDDGDLETRMNLYASFGFRRMRTSRGLRMYVTMADLDRNFRPAD